MKEFTIEVPELHYSIYTIKANTFEEACKLIEDGYIPDDYQTLFSRMFDRNEKEWILNSEKETEENEN
jgi:hypothetical protein